MSKSIVVFSSWGPGNFSTVLDHCRDCSDCKVDLLVSDLPKTPSIQLASEHGIDVLVQPIKGRLILGNTGSERARTKEIEPILRRLQEMERKAVQIDLVVLAFQKILTGPILDEFGARTINVHPADLSVLDAVSKRRRYVGIGGLARSIHDGNVSTRTSVHWVTAGVDEGPLICLGPEVAFSGDGSDPADIATHEIRQKSESDRPCLAKSLEILCGQVSAPTLPFLM